LSLLWFCMTPSFFSPAETADVVFVNGNVYTVNEKQPRAEAVAVKGDRIVFVGSNANAKRFQGGGTRVIDLHGETVVPGMTDAHYHFIGVVTKDSKDPFGGQILRDKQTGEPVGMLLDNAQGFVARHIPVPTQAEIEQAIILAHKRSIELGLTQVQDPGGSYRDVDLYKKLYGEGKLKLRIYKAVYGPGPEAQRLLRDGPIIEAFGDRLNVRAIKVVSDGALGSRGAALL